MRCLFCRRFIHDPCCSVRKIFLEYQPEQIAMVVAALMKMRPAPSQRTDVAFTTTVTSVSVIAERKKRAKKPTTLKVAHSSSDSIAHTRLLKYQMALRSRLVCRMGVHTNRSDQFARPSLSHIQVIPAEGHLRLLDSHVAERPFQGQVEHPR